MVVITCGKARSSARGSLGGGVPPDRTYYYLLVRASRNPADDGRGSKLSERADFDTSPGGAGRPSISMEFTGRGGDQFEGDHARRVGAREAARDAAALRDRRRPPRSRTISHRSTTDSSLSGGISGGRAQITGLDSIDEAQDIAIVLQTGALPVKFETLDRTDISATLGKDSLEAWKAAIGGILLVAIFLLLFYRFLGLVAVTGLVVYAAFLYATILLFNVTLTLPGSPALC